VPVVALWLSILVTVAAAAAAALVIAPAPVQPLALLALVIDEKPFLLVGAALLGTLLARWSPSRAWLVVQLPLMVGIVGVSFIPPVQAIRLARQRHVALDYLRYFKAPVDTSPARPPKTLVYATVEGRPLSLDVYRPGPATPAAKVPAVIVVHGGGWSAGDKGEAPLASERLAGQGFAVFDIQYRLAPQPNWKTATGDVKCAIGWVKGHAREEAGIDVDPERVALLGRSAGAHLALLAAYAPDDPALAPSCDAGDTRVAAVISLYGAGDLVWAYEHPTNPRVFDMPARVASFLGGTPKAVPDRYIQLSPARRATAGAPRTLLLHGGRDQFALPGQTGLLAARLRALGVPHDVLIIPYAQHSFDFVSGGLSGQLAEHAILRFLRGER
jgi:acetyl esterase/lipase